MADTAFYERGFVWLLVVHRAHRRRGIGSALLRHVEAACPIDQFFTSTNLSNAPMRRLLEQQGYVRSGASSTWMRATRRSSTPSACTSHQPERARSRGLTPPDPFNTMLGLRCCIEEVAPNVGLEPRIVV